MNTATETVKSTSRSEAMKRAWETRRANAAKKVTPTTETAAVAPTVVVVAETTAPAPKPTPKADVTPKKADKPVRKGLTPCLCGCNNKVTGDFKQGHDARAKAMVAKVIKGELKISDLPPVLVAALPRLKFVQNLYPAILKMVPKAVA